jgi:hypothetical protein
MDLSRLILFNRSVCILFSSRPGSDALGQWWVQLMVVLVVVTPLIEAFMNAFEAHNRSNIMGRHFRLTTLESRYAFQNCDQDCFIDQARSSMITAVMNASSLHLTSNGVSLISIFSMMQGQTVSLSFSESVSANGLSCLAKVSDRNTINLSFIRLKIDVSNDGEVWREDVVPRWAEMRVSKESSCLTSTEIPLFCGARLQWDHAARWQWILDWGVRQILQYLSFIIACILGAFGEGRKGVLFLAIAFIINALLLLTILVSHLVPSSHTVHRSDNALSCWIYLQRFLANCIMAASLVAESHFLLDLICATFSYLNAAIAVLRLCAPRAPGAPLPLAAVATPLTNLTAHLFVATLLQLGRRRVRLWIREELVERDRAAYDARWAKVLSLPGATAALARLNTLARDVAAAAAADDPPRQRAAAGAPPARPGGGGALAALARTLGGAPRAAPAAAAPSAPPPPVGSVRVLYEQAGRAEGLLRAKAGALALASGGGFVVAAVGGGGGRAVEEWEAARTRVAAGAARVEWAGLKPARRAVEKMVRSYSGDPSRLLDCCRYGVVHGCNSALVQWQRCFCWSNGSHGSLSCSPVLAVRLVGFLLAIVLLERLGGWAG